MNARNGRPPPQPAARVLIGTAPRRRAIEACRRAGLPVIDPHDCTCGLRGRLVVLARSAGGLEVLWPYNERCPIHGPRGHEPPPTARLDRGRSRARTATGAWARREATTT
jgi:hypothetical protein